MAGINAVRLPVGYWALGTTADEAAPFVPGAWACIDAALDWGFQAGIGDRGFQCRSVTADHDAAADTWHVPLCRKPGTSLTICDTMFVAVLAADMHVAEPKHIASSLAAKPYGVNQNQLVFVNTS